MTTRRTVVGAIGALMLSAPAAVGQVDATPAPVDDECPAVAQPVARIRYVDDSIPTSGTGTTWSSPYKSLQTALNEAAANPAIRYDIRVGQGTYKPTTGTDRSIAFELRDNATVRGGYAGYGASSPNARNIDLYLTTLSGNIGSGGSSLDNSLNVVRADWSVSANALLEGFTIRDGRADDFIDAGGGLALSDASPRVTQCTFVSNYANRGGAVNVQNYSSNRRVGFLRCRFFSNTAQFRGGAFNFDAGMARIYNGTFSNNTATDGVSQGGAIYAGGHSMGCGGGPGAAAGPMENGDPTALGGVVVPGPTDFGDLLLMNCLFTQNAAYDGGAIYLVQQAVIDHCTFSTNVATNNGGGINAEWSGYANISNNILWQNTDTAGTATDQDAQFYDPFTIQFNRVNYCCIQGLTGSLGGLANIGSNPLFRSAGSGNFRLQYNSPSVNTGNAGLMPPDRLDMDSDGVRFEPTPQDLDNLTRIACVVDRGAYEFHDCNVNAIDDQDDIAGGAADTNGDRIPDTCQDCNHNGTPDPVEIAAGTLADCNRNGTPDACELSLQGNCNGNAIPDTCEGCAVDLVYVVDTSGSMCGDLVDFCTMVEQVRSSLTSQGLDVRVQVFGIYSCGSCSGATCISRYVDAELTSLVPCYPGTCGPEIMEDESWAPAAAIVAQYYPWRAGAKWYVLPVSDEGPCQGDPCDDTSGSDDDQSVQNAIVVCNNNNVDALPITGSLAWSCVWTMADRLATGTGGMSFHHAVYGSYPNIGAGISTYIRGQAPSFCGTCPRVYLACPIPLPEGEEGTPIDP